VLLIAEPISTPSPRDIHLLQSGFEPTTSGFDTFCVLVKRAKIVTLSCINRTETSSRVNKEQCLVVDEISVRLKNV